MICLNLRELFGDKFRITHDESYAGERSEFRSAEEPWLQIIPGQLGHVFPWSETRLAAATHRRGPVARRLMAIPGVRVEQDAADGVNVSFLPDLFGQVADLLRLKRRRQVSEAERARLAELSRLHSPFRKSPFSECDSAARPCVVVGSVDG